MAGRWFESTTSATVILGNLLFGTNLRMDALVGHDTVIVIVLWDLNELQ